MIYNEVVCWRWVGVIGKCCCVDVCCCDVCEIGVVFLYVWCGVVDGEVGQVYVCNCIGEGCVVWVVVIVEGNVDWEVDCVFVYVEEYVLW